MNRHHEDEALGGAHQGIDVVGPQRDTGDENDATTRAASIACRGTPLPKPDRIGDHAGRKAAPLYSGCFAYFPDALIAVAKLSLIANDQHNPGEPLHWSRGKSNDHADCLLRHQVDHDAMDGDGVPHCVKVAWRALAQAQLWLESHPNAF